MKKQEKICGDIGNNIKKIRSKKGLTQDALCKKANLPYTTLAKLESGVITKPTIQTITRIAKGLNVSIENLIK